MENPPVILAIEDDPFIVDLLKIWLRREGFEVDSAGDGETALELFRQRQPALVILDLKLPGLDGEEVCKRLRAQSDVPILVLTARDEVDDKVRLLTLGADDYLTKPFSFDELVARLRALLRRSKAAGDTQRLTFLDIELIVDTREVTRHGVPIELSAKEFDLLHLFMSNPRRVLTKEIILNHVWGYEYFGDSNIVEVYVGHLRHKLGEPQVIQTVRGVGYRLKM